MNGKNSVKSDEMNERCDRQQNRRAAEREPESVHRNGAASYRNRGQHFGAALPARQVRGARSPLPAHSDRLPDAR